MAVVAYEMVTGQRPFNAGSTEEQLKQQKAGVAINPIARRPNLPLPAQDVILRGLSFKSQARYQNANQFGDSLANALIRPHTSIPKRWLYVLLLILVVAMLSFGAYKYCEEVVTFHAIASITSSQCNRCVVVNPTWPNSDPTAMSHSTKGTSSD